MIAPPDSITQLIAGAAALLAVSFVVAQFFPRILQTAYGGQSEVPMSEIIRRKSVRQAFGFLKGAIAFLGCTILIGLSYLAVMAIVHNVGTIPRWLDVTLIIAGLFSFALGVLLLLIAGAHLTLERLSK